MSQTSVKADRQGYKEGEGDPTQIWTQILFFFICVKTELVTSQLQAGVLWLLVWRYNHDHKE